MYGSPQFFGTRKQPGLAYREMGAATAIEGATPHKLVSLLYAQLVDEIARARGALARKEFATKAQAVAKAVRIVEEGLKAPLDLQRGGELARNLDDLYEYLARRLTLGNVRSDDAVLAECGRLAQTMRESWDAIAPQVEPARDPSPARPVRAAAPRELRGVAA
jgi:flagellar protein FliS